MAKKVDTPAKKSVPVKKAAASPTRAAPVAPKSAAPTARATKNSPAKATPPSKPTPSKTASSSKPTPSKTASSQPAAANKAPATTSPAKQTTAASTAAAKKAPVPNTTNSTPAKKAAAPAAKPVTSVPPAATPSPVPVRKAPAKKAPAVAPPPPAPVVVKGETKDGLKYTKDFDAKFITAQYALLNEARVSLTGQAVRLEDEANSLIDDEMGDVQFDDESGEGDTMVVERERDLFLSARARQDIDEIDSAIARLKNGTYGYSVISLRPIPRERLEAIPWATELTEEKVGGIGRR